MFASNKDTFLNKEECKTIRRIDSKIQKYEAAKIRKACAKGLYFD
jgi:hypothetical protein